MTPKVSRQVAWQRRQRALGRCYRCGGPMPKTRTMKSCEECLARQRTTTQQRRKCLTVDRLEETV